MSAATAPLPEPEPLIEAAAFVLSLRARGIADLSLLRMMETVRREVFAPRRYADLARQDVALPLPCGETMTAPTTVALMLAALGIRPGQRVLEIGTGSGYVTALMAALGAEVRSVERKAVLLDSALQRLRAVGLAENCAMVCGDGFAEPASEARYERILLNGAFEGQGVPASVTSRLAVGGRLVAGTIVGPGAMRILVVERGEDGELKSHFGARARLSRFS